MKYRSIHLIVFSVCATFWAPCAFSQDTTQDKREQISDDVFKHSVKDVETYVIDDTEQENEEAFKSSCAEDEDKSTAGPQIAEENNSDALDD